MPPLKSPKQYGRHYPDPHAYELLGDLARRMGDAASTYINGLPDEELYFIKGGIGQLTTTNCWWLIYELAPAIRGLVEEAEYRRKAEEQPDVQ